MTRQPQLSPSAYSGVRAGSPPRAVEPARLPMDGAERRERSRTQTDPCCAESPRCGRASLDTPPFTSSRRFHKTTVCVIVCRSVNLEERHRMSSLSFPLLLQMAASPPKVKSGEKHRFSTSFCQNGREAPSCSVCGVGRVLPRGGVDC